MCIFLACLQDFPLVNSQGKGLALSLVLACDDQIIINFLSLNNSQTLLGSVTVGKDTWPFVSLSECHANVPYHQHDSDLTFQTYITSMIPILLSKHGISKTF